MAQAQSAQVIEQRAAKLGMRRPVSCSSSTSRPARSPTTGPRGAGPPTLPGTPRDGRGPGTGGPGRGVPGGATGPGGPAGPGGRAAPGAGQARRAGQGRPRPGQADPRAATGPGPGPPPDRDPRARPHASRLTAPPARVRAYRPAGRRDPRAAGPGHRPAARACRGTRGCRGPARPPARPPAPAAAAARRAAPAAPPAALADRPPRRAGAAGRHHASWSIAIVLTLFAGRLVQLQVLESGYYKTAADAEQLTTVNPAGAARHDLRRQRAADLAMTIETYTVTADPTQITRRRQAGRRPEARRPARPDRRAGT